MGMHMLRFCIDQIVENTEDAQNEIQDLKVKYMEKYKRSKEYDAIAEADSKLDEIKTAVGQIKIKLDALSPFN